MKRKQKTKKKLSPRKTLYSLFITFLLYSSYWIHQQVIEPDFPQANEAPVLYANQLGDDFTKIFLKAITSAKSHIVLIIYSLTDPQIIEALKQKSSEGVCIKVICDVRASRGVQRKLGPNIETIMRVSNGLMHTKILVIDHRFSWIGSVNFTRQSLELDGNLLIGFDSEALAAYVLEKADTMNDEGEITNIPHREFEIGGQKVELWFLPDDRSAGTHIRKLIQGAQKTIQVAMFTWTRTDFAKEVIKASHRGVDVKITIDNLSSKGASAKVIQLFRERNIPVGFSKNNTLFHYKLCYIDRNILINGSTNWTGAAFKNNDDCFIVLYDLTSKQKEVMDKLCIHINSISNE